MRKQNISRSSVSHIFREKQKSTQFPKLKIWEKWILIVQEKYGKTQTFQSYGFLKYFRWSRNQYNSQNMGKWIFIVWEKDGKTKTFQIYGFLKYFGLNKNPSNFQNLGKVSSHSKRKIWENTSISKLRVS